MGNFSQDVKYIAPCMFCDIFDVKCPLSGSKRVFSFSPGEDERVYGTFHVMLVLYVSLQF